jgi:phosphatidylinositol alpha-1,6-mannosyltransferase
MGIPCVAFELDGAPEVVLPGETGYLVRAGDAVGLADAINRLIDDAEARQRMGEAGRRHVDPAFRAETMVGEIAAVYEGMIAASQRRMVRRAFQQPALRSSSKQIG